MTKLVIVLIAVIAAAGTHGRAYDNNRYNSRSLQRNDYQQDGNPLLRLRRPAFRSSFGGESFHSSRSNLQSGKGGEIGRNEYSVHDGHVYGAHSGEYFGARSDTLPRRTGRRSGQQ
ncbi:hypothetical protein Bhyg_08747 [Pseudolycoriella hygida]|uniref:Hymenoptaecin n=1 Tax=Pseudolycoriella hygida TaxID=35572 RepID=A0A9Q0S392_9DIPT|nr:hypothetical protein Bhyg_08747 [Pseudolycoriella hygida]